MADIWKKDIRYKVAGFWIAEAKTMCFDLNDGVPQNYHGIDAIEENATDD